VTAARDDPTIRGGRECDGFHRTAGNDAGVEGLQSLSDVFSPWRRTCERKLDVDGVSEAREGEKDWNGDCGVRGCDLEMAPTTETEGDYH